MPYIKIHLADLVHPEDQRSTKSTCNPLKDVETCVNDEDAWEKESFSKCHEKETVVHDSLNNDKPNESSSHDVEQTSPVDGRSGLLQLLEAANKKIALADSERSLVNSNATARVPYETQCSYARSLPQVTETQVKVGRIGNETEEPALRQISQLLSGQPAKQDATSGIIPAKKTRNVRKSTFAEKLMDILTAKGNEDVITWFPKGDSFKVISTNQFTRDVFPKYFKEAKYESFVRKLYRWGFRRVADSPKDTAFYHAMFLRDQPDLCRRMRSCNVIVEEGDKSRRSILEHKEIEARKSSAQFTNDAASVAANNKSSAVSFAGTNTLVQLPELATMTEEVDSSTKQVSSLLNGTSRPSFASSHLLAYPNGLGNGLNLGLKTMMTKPPLEHSLPFVLRGGYGMFPNRLFTNNYNDFMKRPGMGLGVGQSNLNFALSKKLDEICRRYK